MWLILGLGLTKAWCVFDLDNKQIEVKNLEKLTTDPHLWDDSIEAQKIMRRLSQLNQEIQTWSKLDKKVSELEGVLEISLEEEDYSLEEMVQSELTEIAEELSNLEWTFSLTGEYDEQDAIIAIHAGAGGTESQDWAEMMLRMYLRWIDNKGYSGKVLDISHGEEVGIKSVVLQANGRYAFGLLKGEAGVHRLVRISPFDASHSRHTSFALLEVLPAVETEDAGGLVIDPDEIKIEVFRSSGHGGQNVQKNATAVRIIHIPTGIKVSCQNERSQYQNKEIALRILRARLIEKKLKDQADEKARLKGEHISPEWGNQIRSYVLHPYKMVKDHRTNHETADANEVLDGNLDAFLHAFLINNIGGVNKN